MEIISAITGRGRETMTIEDQQRCNQLQTRFNAHRKRHPKYAQSAIVLARILLSHTLTAEEKVELHILATRRNRIKLAMKRDPAKVAQGKVARSAKMRHSIDIMYREMRRDRIIAHYRGKEKKASVNAMQAIWDKQREESKAREAKSA